MQQELLQNSIGTAPKSAATSRLPLFSNHVRDVALYHPNSYKISGPTAVHVEMFRVSCCSFQSSVSPSTVVHLQPTTFWHTSLLQPSRRQENDCTSFRKPCPVAGSNPRGSLLELVESLREHLGESGAISSNCSDINAVQIR